MNTDLIIATVFFLIGLIPAYYFYKKSIRIKEPVYSIKSVNVISDYSSVFPGLKVSYHDEKVENFSVSKVLFFNAGAATLNRDDIARRNPLKLVANSGNILDTAILEVNNPSNEFHLNLDRANNCILIDFEYLNQSDGAVVLLTHTGLSSEEIEVVGDMKEVRGLRRLAPHSLRIRPPLTLAPTVEGIVMTFLGVILLVFGYLIWIGGLVVTDSFLVAVLSAMAGAVLAFFVRRVRDMLELYRPGKIIPNGLEIFDADYYAFPDRG